jgi:3-phenylpropionate/trans-cinnamate dioxygenase ferredoxin subunit
MEVKMALIELTKTGEILPGKMKSIVVSGVNLLVANIDGKFYAMDGICSHARGHLADGKLESKIVTCPVHGSRFDVTTGKVVGGPAQNNLRIYILKIDGDNIKVNIP